MLPLSSISQLLIVSKSMVSSVPSKFRDTVKDSMLSMPSFVDSSVSAISTSWLV